MKCNPASGIFIYTAVDGLVREEALAVGRLEQQVAADREHGLGGASWQGQGLGHPAAGATDRRSGAFFWAN